MELKFISTFSKHVRFLNWVCASQGVIALANIIFP